MHHPITIHFQHECTTAESEQAVQDILSECESRYKDILSITLCTLRPPFDPNYDGAFVNLLKLIPSVLQCEFMEDVIARFLDHTKDEPQSLINALFNNDWNSLNSIIDLIKTDQCNDTRKQIIFQLILERFCSVDKERTYQCILQRTDWESWILQQPGIFRVILENSRSHFNEEFGKYHANISVKISNRYTFADLLELTMNCMGSKSSNNPMNDANGSVMGSVSVQSVKSLDSVSLSHQSNLRSKSANLGGAEVLCQYIRTQQLHHNRNLFDVNDMVLRIIAHHQWSRSTKRKYLSLVIHYLFEVDEAFHTETSLIQRMLKEHDRVRSANAHKLGISEEEYAVKKKEPLKMMNYVFIDMVIAFRSHSIYHSDHRHDDIGDDAKSDREPFDEYMEGRGNIVNVLKNHPPSLPPSLPAQSSERVLTDIKLKKLVEMVMVHTAHIWCDLKRSKLKEWHCTALTLFALKLSQILGKIDESEMIPDAGEIMSVLFSEPNEKDVCVREEEERYRASHQLQALIYHSYPQYFEGASFLNLVHVLFIPTDTVTPAHFDGDGDEDPLHMNANIHLFNVSVVQGMSAKQVRFVRI